MKRFLCCLLACLLLTASVSAAPEASFQFESRELGFSLTVPGLTGADVTAEVTDNRVDLYHTPSRAQWGGLIGSIQVVMPRSAVTAPPYNTRAYRILAMGADRAFLWKSPGGGVNSGGTELASFVETAGALSVDVLREALVPDTPDAWPVLSTQSRRAYLPVENGRIRPDDPLTRGELAQMLYALLDADNLNAVPSAFSDLDGRICAQAASYLASYGIFTGFADGTFRPDAAVTRAQLAVLLHRCQFAAPVGQYGEASAFSDVPDGYWAEAYLYSARVLGWMQGDSTGAFRPDDAVTRAQAVTVINRMLGRDESQTVIPESISITDLPAGHWARGNLLEAAGLLPDPGSVQPVRLPDGTSAWYFADASYGWAAANTRLYVTDNGGRSWAATDAVLPFPASDLFFFNSNTGLVLGSDDENACSLWYTLDGGQTWDDFFTSPESRRLCLPVEQFATEAGMYASLCSASLRPAGGDTVYLTVRYCPYDSIYFADLETVRQTAITFEFASLVIGSR